MLFCEVLLTEEPELSSGGRFNTAVGVRTGKLRLAGKGTGGISMSGDGVGILGLILLNPVVVSMVSSCCVPSGHARVRGLRMAKMT